MPEWMFQVASLRLLSVRLDILAQPEGVVDGGVDVAAGDGVADTVEAEAAVRVAHRLLRPAGGERVVVDGAEVGAERLQIEVEVVERQSAVLDHELVDLARLHAVGIRSEEHTSELQSLMRISYAVFCLTKKQTNEPHS